MPSRGSTTMSATTTFGRLIYPVVRIDNWQPLSMNRVMRLHYHARNRRLAEDAFVVRAAFMDTKIPKAAGKRRVRLFFGWPDKKGMESRAPDGDNALKAIADGLTACGMVKDDSFRWMCWGSIDGGPAAVDAPFVEISIEEC